MKGKKTGGRVKGTQNKNKYAIRELLENRFPNYDPVLAMADIANDKTVELSLRLQANKEVAKYAHPQLKAVEIKEVTQLEQLLAMPPEQRQELLVKLKNQLHEKR